MWKWLWQRIQDEPAMTAGLIGAAVSLAISLGLALTPEQVGFIMAFVVALLSWLTRKVVTPTAKANAAVASLQLQAEEYDGKHERGR